MKKKFSLFSLFLLIIGVVLVYSWIHLPKESKIASPWIEGGRTAINLWFPQVAEASDQNDSQPELTAKSAYFVDINSGQVLFQKNPHFKLPIASLTKIMTAIVTVENHNFSDEILISDQAASMEPDHMLLKSGEKLTVEELLYGVFLVSANDAAEALAENTAGGRESFIKEMNQKAKMLTMNDTLFINPSGLEEDGKEQFSSAYDVILMSRYAIKQFPRLVDFSSTYHKTISQTLTHQDYDMYSGINLLTTYPGVMGFKTGYTPEAGLTLVTLAQKEGHWVMGVILNSENRREEAKELLDYSFKKLGIPN